MKYSINKLSSIVIVLGFFVFTTSVFGIEVVQVKSNVAKYSLQDKMQYIKEKKDILTINDVLQKLQNDTVKLQKGAVPAFTKGNRAIWFFVKIQNDAPDKKDMVLKIQWRNLEKIDLYYVYDNDGRYNGKIKNYKSGVVVPIKKRAIEHRNFVFPLNIKTNSTVLIAARIESDGQIEMPLFLMNRKTFEREDVVLLLFQGLFFGILAIMIFYNLFIYFSTRESGYLVYVCFVLANFIYQLASVGFGYQFLWTDSAWFEKGSAVILGDFTFAVAAYFTADYMKFKKNAPRLYNFAIFLACCWIVTTVIGISFTTAYSVYYSASLSGISGIFALSCGVYLWRKGFPEAQYFTIAWSAMILSTIIFILYLNGVFEQNFVTLHIQQFGSIFEIVLLSLGLANRINVMKNKLANVNVDLELKVEQRTEKLHVTMKELQLTNNELVETRDYLWGEMELAKKIQTILLPEKPEIDGYDIVAYMEPAEAVGGDYYDIINYDAIDWVIIGDVSGHGVPSGLIMMMVQASIHTYLNENPHAKPSNLLELVGETISKNIKKMKEQKFMTITAFSFLKNNDILYSGRHEIIMIYRAAEGIVETIMPEGRIITFWDVASKDVDKRIVLHKDDILLLYTDGIVEAMDDDKELYSYHQLIEILQANGREKVDVILKRVLDSLQEYTVDDDVTAVILKKK